MNAFFTELIYFVSVSWIGFFVLKSLKPRSNGTSKFDIFFTSVSATTVSSMSVVEMEVFSDAQLIVMTILMFIGSEVFTSMIGLHLRWILKLEQDLSNLSTYTLKNIVAAAFDTTSSISDSSVNIHPLADIDLGVIVPAEAAAHDDEDQFYPSNESASNQRNGDNNFLTDFITSNSVLPLQSSSSSSRYLKYKSIKFLGFVVLGYLLVLHVLGVTFVTIYFSIYSSAKKVLERKNLKESTFAIFTTVSTFASCGFVPTNENMIVFAKNSGLLWILIPQALLGNTLFPSLLRFTIWFLGKYIKKDEAKYLLDKNEGLGYLHLLPGLHSWLLVFTVLGFVVIQWILLGVMEWHNDGVTGLTIYQKIVGFLFQAVNARHTGETVLDIATIAPAILVLFVVMMYLPPYTSFLPRKEGDEELKKKRRKSIKDNIIFSQLTYLVIFIILICICERKNMKEDPVNFSLLNIVTEVISGYGNVGFTTGYSCERRLKTEDFCENKWYGFSGRWSNQGKLLLIFVMIFGRLKKFNMNGGRAWKLL
ncbi:Sodium transporter HKT1 [Heracleum sosnowskyi]|uniref:Sodium transporter HKT1 n=1 Tax=Heracleum sosnowskyi TaxID=360622 RepID=A0AAD8IT90_9APIA|nr:Sodium transporter HKT1 [Heracleum sosnowskyi]